MSYFASIDIETLGVSLDAPIVQFGLVFANWRTGEIIGEYETNVIHDQYDHCEPTAMAMHPGILSEIGRGEGLHIDRLAPTVCSVLQRFGVINRQRLVVAGKNVAGFDIPRLRHQCESWDGYVPTYHRVIDPGMLYWWPEVDDVPPDLKTCLERAGLTADVAHTALSDARDVANLIIHHMKRWGLGERSQ